MNVAVKVTLRCRNTCVHIRHCKPAGTKIPVCIGYVLIVW